MHTPDERQLCGAIRSKSFLTNVEIHAILADRDFFQPNLRDALAPEAPIDWTDCQPIFLLTELEDAGIIHDLIKCLRMSEERMRLLCGDALTEHMWLPFAKLGHEQLEELWQFVADEAADLFARHAAVAGVVAMHHFHPDRRPEAVAFLERLLGRVDIFPVDHLAGILCDCADSGLTELADQAEEFASRMDDGETAHPMATADDVRRAFRDGARKDFISGRLSLLCTKSSFYEFVWTVLSHVQRSATEPACYSWSPAQHTEPQVICSRRCAPCTTRAEGNTLSRRASQRVSTGTDPVALHSPENDEVLIVRPLATRQAGTAPGSGELVGR